MSHDLLPCPFCGRQAELRTTWFGRHNQPLSKPRYYVVCRRCLAGQRVTCDTKSLAISRWNRRGTMPTTANDQTAENKPAVVTPPTE
jgi:Lar family restriction alleviation protein